MKRDEHITLSGGAMGAPEGVLEPTVSVFEKNDPVRRRIYLTLYRCNAIGECNALRGCLDSCDAAARTIAGAIRELGAEQAISFTVRSAWHWRIFLRVKYAVAPPLLIIDGKAYTHGTASDREALKSHLRKLLV